MERGYKIPFKEHPPLSKELIFKQTQRSELEEVNNLLLKRAVERILDCQQVICLHSSNDSNSFSSVQECYYPLSISGRLAVKGPKSSSSVGTQTLHHSPDFIIGTDHQSRQVRSDSIPEFQIHRDGIPH